MEKDCSGPFPFGINQDIIQYMTTSIDIRSVLMVTMFSVVALFVSLLAWTVA